jgi:pyruvate dehydrogenase E1 component alpha subunit
MPRKGAARATRASKSNGAALSQAPVGRDERPETLVGYYRQMVLIRRFEERTGEMYTRAKIGGYCHLNLGEEATIVGTIEPLEAKDYIFTNYREHGYALARGIDPGRIMAELFGKETGVSRGRGGSMHLFDLRTRFMGGYAIVGGQIPLAVGAGLAITYRELDEVVLCQLGDATTNAGAFHEGLNLAQLWKLPVVFLIVNNQYGMGTTVERASAEPELYRRACAYRMASERVDGHDVLAVRDAMRRAVQRARQEQLPTLLEAVSFRQRGHSVVDPARYRAREEVEEGLRQDPVALLRRQLLEAGVLDEAAAARLDSEVEHQVQEAVEFADQSPDPNPADLFAYTYASEVENVSRSYPGEPTVADA